MAARSQSACCRASWKGSVKPRWLPPRGRRQRWTSAAGGWPSRPGQASLQEHALDLGLVGQRHEQRLDEAEPDLAGVGDQLERREVDVVGAHLAVADHAVAGELEAGEAELGDAHCSL